MLMCVWEMFSTLLATGLRTPPATPITNATTRTPEPTPHTDSAQKTEDRRETDVNGDGSVLGNLDCHSWSWPHASQRGIVSLRLHLRCPLSILLLSVCLRPSFACPVVG
ncbi:unnamed protein product [Clonostachys rosea f. rosea IK726]|uniref:Uncharacterized protein n=1 Tax=Clonostachys rosea f. rosea IK726 TaxID=1349383 RepID=A0ACA9TLI0_BIOOC|nr:unnamed protein product [Clonostachys rosea f. rosea IK726]